MMAWIEFLLMVSGGMALIGVGAAEDKEQGWALFVAGIVFLATASQI